MQFVTDGHGTSGRLIQHPNAHIQPEVGYANLEFSLIGFFFVVDVRLLCPCVCVSVESPEYEGTVRIGFITGSQGLFSQVCARCRETLERSVESNRGGTHPGYSGTRMK